MAGIRFTDDQVRMLRSNPWVKSATPRYVSFTKEFMEEFIDLHSKGLTRYEIFESHGLPVEFREYLLSNRSAFPCPSPRRKKTGTPRSGFPFLNRSAFS